MNYPVLVFKLLLMLVALGKTGGDTDLFYAPGSND